MDGTIVRTPKIDFSTIDNLKKMTSSYIEAQDTFYLSDEKPRPATSYDMDGLCWLRIDVNSGEIVGLQIDDFESVFINKYPELKKVWADTKHFYKNKSKKNKTRDSESFLLIIINFIVSMFKNNPHQTTMQMLPSSHA